MRLGTTTAVFVGALALVLPTAGQSLADGWDHDDHDGRNLGTLHYRFRDDDGDVRSAQIHPADNDTCYQLTHTSEDEPAVEVRNETRSIAVLFRDRDCGGRAVRTLEPGENARRVDVASVFFKPVDDDDEGRWEHGGRWDHDGRDDDDRGEWNGRRGDESRQGGRPTGRPASHQAGRKAGHGVPEDLFNTIFRPLG